MHQAIVSDGKGFVQVMQRPALNALSLPEGPGMIARSDLDHGAIIEVIAAGLCGSDLQVLANPHTEQNQILGHEAVGRVVEVDPSVSTVRPGDRVIIPFNDGCGQCQYCAQGYHAYCQTTNPFRKGATYGMGIKLGGWMGLQTQKAVVPYADGNLIVLLDSRWAEEHWDTALLLSDVLPTAYQGAQRVATDDVQNVYIAGTGAIGLAVAYLLEKLWQKRVILADPHEVRRTEAEHASFETVDPIGTALDEDLLQHIGLPEGFDAAVDCVGQAEPNVTD